MKYLYYHLWRLLSKIKTNNMPATNAMILISSFQFLNLLLIYIFIKYYSLITIDFDSKLDIYIFSILLGVVVYTINYFYLYKKRNNLFEKYKNESKRRRTIGVILLVFYGLGSFILTMYFLSIYTANILNYFILRWRPEIKVSAIVYLFCFSIANKHV